jgi:putative ABC transport system permease protein
MFGYVWRDLVRNPRRTLAALAGISLGVGLFSGVLFFSDGSRATLTKRAIAPLALDMQAVLKTPLGRSLQFGERLEGPPALPAGARATVTLTVANQAGVPANEVVVNDEPAPPLAYVPGSLTMNGARVGDVGGRIALSQGQAQTGLNLGTVPPRTTITLRYRVLATSAIPATAALPLQGRISSRENVVPLRANAPPPATVAQLAARLRTIPGVTAADELSSVDLPALSLRAGATTISDPVRVFAFDPAYQQHYPSIRGVSGALRPAAAAVSAEAARALGVRDGGVIRLAIPGQAPLILPVSAVVDARQARPLFYSRKTKKLEDFLYVPNVVILPPAIFERRIRPAFQAVAAAEGNVVRSLPVSEVDVLVARSRLNSDPASAFAQTSGIARRVSDASPGETLLIDNISNTLQVATDDAAAGRRMFVFLGLPGILLAIFLTAYSGSILATTQRRENAILRLRGAHRGQLLRLLVTKAVLLAGAGSVIGTVTGFVLVMALLGRAALIDAPRQEVAATAAAGLAAGLLATALALCLPGIRSLRREISQERREITANPVPAWRRWRLDLVLLAGAAAAEGVAYATGAFDAPVASVSQGLAVSLPSRLLLAPLVAWFGGTLIAVRALQTVTARLPVGDPARFGPVMRGNLFRSLRRRSWALATGTVGVGLVIALATGLAMFSATYTSSKTADSAFTVGSDLRVAPSATSASPHPASSAGRLRVDGVTEVTPVVSTLENSVFVAQYNQDRRDLAAIDPESFARTAALRDSFFAGASAREALASLAEHPDGLLVDAETASRFSVGVGDQVKVLLARGTKRQALRPFVVTGLFEKFPGFPLGVNLVMNIASYQAATHLTDADFFLLKARDASPAGLERAEAALRAGPGRSDPITIESTPAALNKDQSSLTALDIHGLVNLDSVFTTLMSAAAIGIFVFGLLLHRRREYLTLRALGLPARTLFGLVLAEGALVVACGLLAGLPVGIGMGYLFVHILRPLFILDPVAVIPAGDLALLASLPVLTALACAFTATISLRRLRPTEVLRET